MFDNLFDDTMGIIKRWQPKQNYSNEVQYRDDLLTMLRSQLNDRQDMFSFGPKERVRIAKEDGRGLCDIGINDRIGIELKKDLHKKSDVDRLYGQLADYKRQYKDIIILLVGETEKEQLEHLRDKISDLTKAGDNLWLDQPLRIKIVDKGSGNSGVPKTRSPFDLH